MRMTHDAVENPIEVPEISVQHYERSGWQVTDRQPIATTKAAARRRDHKDEREAN
jgi:hypothetical protein